MLPEAWAVKFQDPAFEVTILVQRLTMQGQTRESWLTNPDRAAYFLKPFGSNHREIRETDSSPAPSKTIPLEFTESLLFATRQSLSP